MLIFCPFPHFLQLLNSGSDFLLPVVVKCLDDVLRKGGQAQDAGGDGGRRTGGQVRLLSGWLQSVPKQIQSDLTDSWVI